MKTEKDPKKIDMSLVDLVLRAYHAGIFPMAESAKSAEIFWVDPDRRGIIPLDQVHIPRRLRKTLRNHPYEIRHDTVFHNVVEQCSAKSKGRSKTWINEKIKQIYDVLNRMGYAHSLEVWDPKTQKLVGGLYGIIIGGAYFGESMFSLEKDTSKIALAHLIARLRYNRFHLLDTQFVTKHLQQFGAVEISRKDYHKQLHHAISLNCDFYAGSEEECLSSLLHSLTQTS
jgi:leucyl/phenylalanyl-tRNA--protein transferase